MKRFITLLLAAAMVLSLAACGEKGTTIGGLSENDQEDTVKKDPIGAQYLQDLAVKTAAYPDLPAMPSEAELDEAFSTIDYDKMGAEAYEKAQEKIWEDWDARSTAYYDALKALRSEGTAQPDAFHGFCRQPLQLCPLYRRLVIGRGLALDKVNRVSRTDRQTVSKPVAVIVAQQLRLAVHDCNRALMARLRAQAAAGAGGFVNFNDRSFHVASPCSRSFASRFAFRSASIFA